jgi:hypothetical protein
MGRRATRDHADKIAGGNRVGGRSAQALSQILALDTALGQGQAARTHTTIFTAGSLGADIALLHVFSSIEHRINSQLLGSPDHGLGRLIDGRLDRVRHFQTLGRGCFRFGFRSDAFSLYGSSHYYLLYGCVS